MTAADFPTYFHFPSINRLIHKYASISSLFSSILSQSAVPFVKNTTTPSFHLFPPRSTLAPYLHSYPYMFYIIRPLVKHY